MLFKIVVSKKTGAEMLPFFLGYFKTLLFEDACDFL